MSADAIANAAVALFGLAAEFDTPEATLEASRTVVRLGYTRAEAYTPFPVDGLAESLGLRRTPMARVVLLAAIAGAIAGYAMQWFANVVQYRMNIGGRPPNSWPMFMPITFEMAILFAGVMGVASMLWLNRLPQPYHPMFRIDAFARASRDRFFLCIESTDPRFDVVRTRKMLEALDPLAVIEVPA